jgi:hypothetical protein
VRSQAFRTMAAFIKQLEVVPYEVRARCTLLGSQDCITHSTARAAVQTPVAGAGAVPATAPSTSTVAAGGGGKQDEGWAGWALSSLSRTVRCPTPAVVVSTLHAVQLMPPHHDAAGGRSRGDADQHQPRRGRCSRQASCVRRAGRTRDSPCVGAAFVNWVGVVGSAGPVTGGGDVLARRRGWLG